MRMTVSANLAAASITCSQLSRTSSSLLAPIARATDSADIWSPTSFMPRPPRHGGGHETRIRQRGQLDQPDVNLEARKRAAGHLQYKPGLSDAPGSGQRD